jgi:hypothetical protein
MKFSTGVFQIDPMTCACSPAAAVPASAKIPVPIMAPMPMQVRANGPRTRFIWRSGAAASAIRWSALLVLKSWRATARDRVTNGFGWSILSFDVDLVVATQRRGYSSGAHLAAKIDMFDMSSANLIGGFVFGSIGFIAFIYGKRMNLWKIMLCGLALMIFPYFIADTVILYAIGAFGTAAFLFLRE